MKALNETVTEINKTLSENKIKFVLTRFNSSKKTDPDDLDLLVPNIFFKKVIKVLKEQGYKTSSHDRALGGRIKGMQINLVKPLRIKIDLHRDFTWRCSRYFNPDLIWKNLINVKIGKIKVWVPSDEANAFIVIVNIIFEKTYVTEEDYRYVKSQFSHLSLNKLFDNEAEKYKWNKTYSKFKNWFEKAENYSRYPVFVPFDLVLYSYLEKLIREGRIDLISLMYYFFFRVRYILNKILPYE